MMLLHDVLSLLSDTSSFLLVELFNVEGIHHRRRNFY